MEGVYECDLEIGREQYERSADDPDHRNIHDAIPYAVFDTLREEYESYCEDGELGEFQSLFDIRKPSRLFVEGSSPESWEETEDFIVTGSYEGGKMVLCQVCSCREKEGYVYDKVRSQLDSFELMQLKLNSQHDAESDLDEYLTGKFGIAADLAPGEVEQVNHTDIEEAMASEGSYTLSLLVREYPKQGEVAFDLDAVTP
jgi:hypothetical protein